MSYCRWSSDDFQCDVYVYESCYGGFSTHVAASRKVFKEPIPEKVPFDKEHQKEWFERHKKIMAMCGDAEHIDIGLPFDGETYNGQTIEECIERLQALKAVGYNVPQYAIESLIKESESEQNNQISKK